ncbi:MAG: RDD family protein [Methanomicrobiales archaeon]|nr:RDD family protein [Methanomicrobiales archaeon]
MPSNFCPNCGAKLQYPEAEICPSCGVRIKAPPSPPGELYAGFWTRVFAYLIDSVILAIPSAIIVIFVTVGAFSDSMNAFSGIMGPLSLDNITSPGTLVPSAPNSPDLGSLFGSLLLAMIEATVIVLAIRWVYFAYLESSQRQATFGKAALGLMVIDGGGHRISFARATGRWLGKLISWVIFGIGFYLIGFTEKKQGLHDIIADTCVVYRNRYPVPC